MNKKIVSIYSIIHFIVDFSCAFLILKILSRKVDSVAYLSLGILYYNFFAFAMQFPIGIIADRVNKNALCSGFGCLLVAFAYGFVDFGIISCIIAGVGNAMFHVGGGIDVLNISDKKATLSGIFVATGAMGVYLGGLLDFNSAYIIGVLLISAVALFWLYNQIKGKVSNAEVSIPRVNKTELLAIVCLMITVIIRGYVGLTLAFEWKSSLLLAVISICAVVLGKMIGGIVGDKIGFEKISVISLLVSAVLFIFAFDNYVLGIIAILFFNMTMPITLTALSNILDNNKGMAFGLLTVALFIGGVPALFGYSKLCFSPIGLCSISLISMVILYVGIKKYNMLMEKN